MQKATAVFKQSSNILAMKYRGAKDKESRDTKHSAKMKNTSRVDADGNVIKKPEAIIY